MAVGSMGGSRNKPRTGKRALQAGRALELVQETLLGEAAARMVASLFVFGEDGEMVAVNEAACALTGWTREELLANPADALAGNPKQAAPFRAELLAKGRLAGTGRVRTKAGERIDVSYVASMTRVAGTPFLVVVAAAAPAPATGGARRARASRSAG